MDARRCHRLRRFEHPLRRLHDHGAFRRPNVERISRLGGTCPSHREEFQERYLKVALDPVLRVGRLARSGPGGRTARRDWERTASAVVAACDTGLPSRRRGLESRPPPCRSACSAAEYFANRGARPRVEGARLVIEILPPELSLDG